MDIIIYYLLSDLIIYYRENCQNVITKLSYQFMDLTNKGLFLMYIKNLVKLGLLFQVSPPSIKNMFLTVMKIISI
jgi:hypothetical protein